MSLRAGKATLTFQTFHRPRNPTLVRRTLWVELTSKQDNLRSI
jgi:hypothetical protein